MADSFSSGAVTAPFRSDLGGRLPDLPGRDDSDRDRDGKQLIVGRDIVLNGEITACDRLVVEGSVDAKLSNSREVEITDKGLFKGLAEVDTAIIGGYFEGTLTVRGRLSITETGRVAGEISYGEIEIKAGGQITGTITVLEAGPTATLVAAGE